MICKELIPEQLVTTNGCGSSYWAAWVFRIPRWMSAPFTRCCDRHDIRYQEGDYTLDADPAGEGRSYVKLITKEHHDDELYNCWYYAAFQGPKWKRGVLLRMADIGYWMLNSRLSDACYLRAG